MSQMKMCDVEDGMCEGEGTTAAFLVEMLLLFFKSERCAIVVIAKDTYGVTVAIKVIKITGLYSFFLKILC